MENQESKYLGEEKASYYKMVAGKEWRKFENYDLCIDSSIGTEKTANIICDYVKNMEKVYN